MPMRRQALLLDAISKSDEHGHGYLLFRVRNPWRLDTSPLVRGSVLAPPPQGLSTTGGSEVSTRPRRDSRPAPPLV